MTTIKIDRLKVIETLTNSADEIEAKAKIHQKQVDAFQNAEEKWHKDALRIVAKQINKAENVRIWQRKNNTNVDFDLPAGILPEKPERDDYVTTQYVSLVEVEEIRQHIRILSMGVDDTINMSALKSMSQYL